MGIRSVREVRGRNRVRQFPGRKGRREGGREGWRERGREGENERMEGGHTVVCPHVISTSVP